MLLSCKCIFDCYTLYITYSWSRFDGIVLPLIGISLRAHLFVNWEGQNAIVLRINICSLADERGELLKNLLLNLSDYILIDTLISKASFKNMFPPPSNILRNFMTQDPGIFSSLIFLGEAVNNVVSLCTYNMYTFFVADICIVFLLHRNWCLESWGELVFEIILFQDISQANCGNIFEKQSFTFLIRQHRVVHN